MPRRTAEERAASFYRAGALPAEPPAYMSARARTLWREIVACKPVDWFDPASLGLLVEHCEVRARLEKVWRRLREVEIGTKESASVTNEARVLGARLSTSARELRLTVQQLVEMQARKNRERAPEATRSETESVLLGGSARWNKAA